MAKWLILIAGVFLFFNGMTARRYGYADPEQHCFNMDYIKLVGCFGTPTGPSLVVWGSTLIGAGLIA
ncbi:hypothetical protein [Arvimicrobium flavum]|uniref:hypothetical protein n=1 Tax=Arvimicrobium flavum TaxID=3393320 RepID=UPI00237A55FD|nr:hypothetical protein [Mesorhizobium shangrilense]